MGIGRFIVGAGVSGVAIFAGANAMDDNTTRNSAGDITQSGGLGALKIKVGDCIQMPSASTKVQSVEGVPCSTPHDAQAFANFDLPNSSAYPTNASQQADQGCLSRWSAALGTSYSQETSLDINTMYPLKESWDVDKGVTCFVVSADGSRITGSKL